MLVEKSLPSEIHGTVIAVLITGSVVLKAVMYFKRKKMAFQGPHVKRMDAINHPQEKNWL